MGTLGWFMLLTAFSNGCTAMTGVEAVSNGVPAFRPPEAKNAAQTLVAMAVLAITMFVGITLLAQAYHVVPSETETGRVADRERDVRRRGALYFLRAARDDADPGARRQHRLRDFPGWRPSSRETATCRGSSPTRAIVSRSRTASSR
jgi:hypothetical protein